jgi:hypothetical protein
MNIIELFEAAGIYKENATEFILEDSNKVSKYLDLQKEQNPNIDTTAATRLIEALQNYPNELWFIAYNRILYNFFAKTNHTRSRFISDRIVKVSHQEIHTFVEKFLIEDLDSYFEQKISQNKFEEIDDFLVVKEYLPQQSLDKLEAKITEKFDFIFNTLDQNPMEIEAIRINFIKYRSFYDFLSHFKSPKIDEKIKMLLSKFSSLSNFVIQTEFNNPMRMVMANYKTEDHDLANLLKNNKEETIARTQKFSPSSSSALTTGGTIAIVLIVIRLILLMVRCNQ